MPLSFSRDNFPMFFLVEEGPPLSTKEVRLATVLREMPYAISFSQRVFLFQNLVARDKGDHQGDIVNFQQGKAIHVHIRRNFIYEDAFEKLSPDNGKDDLFSFTKNANMTFNGDDLFRTKYEAENASGFDECCGHVRSRDRWRRTLS